MNTSKAIDISKSSLISLKAELSRKQDEVLKAKSNKPNPDAAHHSLKLKRNLVEKKKRKKDLKEDECEKIDSDLVDEDDEVLKKSREILEAKSKLYDHLQERILTTDHGKSEYLVNFDQKTIDKQKEDDSDRKQTADKPDNEPSDVEEDFEDEDDWVDFTDALGRSKRCLRKDLELMRQKDDELLRQIKPPSPPPQSSNENDDLPRSSISQELLSSDMHREIMRRKWELQEQKLLNKTDIHYQDLLFDEARTHGVGYFNFSTDEEERAKQQNDLLHLRQDTLKRQEEAQGLRNRRNQQLQARLKAARMRNRQRLGLPLDDDEKSDDQNDVILIAETANKNDNDEENKNKLEELEKSLKRAAHVRPWDIGKDGVKPQEVMSQEEWVENKREERISEFAPPSAFIEDTSPGLNISLKRGQSGLFFTSKKLCTATLQASASTSTNLSNKQSIKEKIIKIRNELSDDSSEGEDEEVSEENHQKRAEIPPPLTMEYFGGSSHKSVKGKNPKSSSENIDDAISKGLKFLEKQSEIKRTKREKGLLDLI